VKKVLIITYYWPPAGGPGVQRWLKFVKYLRDFNWEPVVYTVKNPEYPVIDQSLASEIPDGIEVLQNEIFEPYSIASKIFRNKTEKVKGGFIENKQSLSSKISTWIRGNFFIPDARMFWINPSVKFLGKYLKKNPVDAIISTGPPHSMHLIAAGILEKKKKIKVPWISDFRDPWTNIDYYHRLNLSKFADKEHHRLEKLVLDKSTRAIVVGPTMKKEFQQITDTSIELIENGHDINTDSMPSVVLDDKFSISHIGSMNADRNPKLLWEVLNSISSEVDEFKSDLKIKLIGNVSDEIFADIRNKDLESNLLYSEYIQHKDVHDFQRKSALLLLVLNNTPNSKGILTGKLFEYIAAQRPILAIGPCDGDAAQVIQESKSGYIFDYDNREDLKSKIIDLYSDWKSGNLLVNSENVDKYSRYSASRRLAQILDEIT
jgi:glycosyltransferase involved in cell wall biosynthesis